MEWAETDVCLAELLVSLPKPPEEMPKPIPKTLVSFTSEGKLIILSEET